MENGEYNPYETSKIIFEDDKVKFIEVFDRKAAEYFGGWDYKDNWNDKYRNGDLYFIIDSSDDEDYSMYNNDGKTEFRKISSNVTFTDPTDIYKEFPTIKGLIGEKVFGSKVYELLVKIKNGYNPGWQSLGKYDSLLDDIVFNEKSPGLTKITIGFSDYEEYLKLFEDLDQEDIHDVINNLDYDGYDNQYRYETQGEWGEGRIYEYYLNDENKEKVDEIVSLLTKTPSDLSVEDRMGLFYDNFRDAADEITNAWATIESTCVGSKIYQELLDEFGNKFFTVGIIEVHPLRRYKTTVNTLIKLFNVVGNKSQTLEELLMSIIRKFDNDSHGGYDEMYWNTSCDDFDMVTFNGDAKWYIDRVYENIIDSNEYKDIYEYSEIISRIKSEYGFDKWIQSKLNPDLSFRIEDIDKKTNNLILIVKGGDKAAEKRSMSYDEFKRFETQYELFENKKIFTESVDHKTKSALKWLNKEFGDLTEVVKGSRTFYVDKKGLPLIVYINNGPIILINYDRIWNLIKNIFGLKDSQIKEILTIWLEETYNLRGFRVYTDWNEIVKWNRPLLRK
jgi:hypothetical protein